MWKDEFLKEVDPKLAEYKEAWVDKSKSREEVSAIKQRLITEIEALSLGDEATSYFHGQCQQIEYRWTRPR